MARYAIIPARAGSKGIPGKNWKELDGIPLILYTVRLAVYSNAFDQILVTTDCNQIISIVEGENQEKISVRDRPADLAQDETGMIDVILDVIQHFDLESDDEFVLLQPTSPFRQPHQLQEILDLEMTSEELVVSFERLEHGLSWLFTMVQDIMVPITKVQSTRRQEDQPVFTYNGAFYRCHVGQVLNTGKIFYGKTVPYIMDTYSSIDIDNEADFSYAEFLLQNKTIGLDHMVS